MLYGCVQASKLWYNKLTKVLRAEGYEHSPTDPCVMWWVVDGKVFLLLIYVDDILVLADEVELERIEEVFVREYTWITFEVNNQHSYLGMQVSLEQGTVTIDMKNFVDKLIGDCVNLREYTSPAAKNAFLVDPKAELLNKADRKLFHTIVAKLLYLSNRARPDLLTIVSFLCTRVTKATKEDAAKLSRVLGYLKKTRGETLRRRPAGMLQVTAYVDASFAPHSDSKSHTGIVIFIGGAMVFAASRKQKCVTKSPTESELVGLTDNISFIELFKVFFCFVTHTEKRSPLIYQDSTSVISLVTKGGGVVRTKHLRVRMNLCKEAVDEERVRIAYVHTSKMIADGLTKALEGKAFITFKRNMLGEQGEETV